MDKKDQEIKKALEGMQSPLSDPGFTDRVVSMHLAKSGQKSHLIQVDMGSLLTGMMAVAASMFLSHANAVFNLGLSEEHLAVLQVLPVLYLIFQVMNEYFSQKDRPGPRWSMVAKSLLIGLICLGMTTSAGRKEIPAVAAPNATSEIAALQPEYGRPFP